MQLNAHATYGRELHRTRIKCDVFLPLEVGVVGSCVCAEIGEVGGECFGRLKIKRIYVT